MDVLVEFDVPAQMRDGVTLYANVYRPVGHGPWPTLLRRLPYGKDDPAEIAWAGIDPVQAARDGFMVVIQDARGRFASEGIWEPFRFEGTDGHDSVEWAATLPGSNGRVGMFGGSYDGNTQLLAARERPASLAAVAPLMTWSEPMNGVFARGGAVELGLTLAWSLVIGLDHVSRLDAEDPQLQHRVNALLDEWDHLPEEGYWELPVNSLRALQRHAVPEIGAISALDAPSVPQRARIASGHNQIEVPTFHTAGWYDLFLQGTLDNYEAMVRLGREARLVVGPWTHPAQSDPVGEQAFGIRAGREGPPVDRHGNWSDLQLAWFHSHLASRVDRELPHAPVRVFVMGRNEWRDELAWPLANAVDVRWFFRSDGSLSRAEPGPNEAATEFAYDPLNPVPTVGGNTSMWPGYRPGPHDQNRVEAREDVAVFTSEPLDEDLEVTGRVRVVLHAESSAVSTDWVARLCDVHPDGRSFNLCDGIHRVVRGADACSRYEVDLWSTCNVFLRGHRLRVHVTSSSFPRWDRNMNTGEQGQTRTEIAHQRIYHATRRASYIKLPIPA